METPNPPEGFDISVLDPDIILDVLRIKRQNGRLNLVIKELQKYVTHHKKFQKGELSLFHSFFDLGSEYNLDKTLRAKTKKQRLEELSKPRKFMSIEEVNLHRDLEDFFGRFFQIYKKVANKEGLFVEKTRIKMQGAVQQIVDREERLLTQWSEYEKSVGLLKLWMGKMKSAREVIQKAEKKKKVKYEKLEEMMGDFRKKELEYEDVETLCLFIEEQTREECLFVRRLLEEKLVYSLSQMICDFQKHYQAMADEYKSFGMEMKLQERMDKYKPVAPERVNHILFPRKVYELKSTKRVVKVMLGEIMRRPEEDMDVPRCVLLMIDFICEYLDKQGIFRKSGKKMQIDRFLMLLNQDNLALLEPFWVESHVHTICTALKEYCRALPYDFCKWDDFKEFQRVRHVNKRSQFIIDALAKQDPWTPIFFYHIIDLMRKVDEHKDKNLMGAENLANVWPINLFKHNMLKSEEAKRDPQTLMQVHVMTTQMKEIFLHMIVDFHVIFPTKPELPDIKKERGVKASHEEIKSLKERLLFAVEEEQKRFNRRASVKVKVHNFNVLDHLKNTPLPFAKMKWKEGVEKKEVIKETPLPGFLDEDESIESIYKQNFESKTQIENEYQVSCIEILEHPSDNSDFVIISDNIGLIKAFQVDNFREGFSEDPCFAYQHGYEKITALAVIPNEESLAECLIASTATNVQGETSMKIWKCFMLTEEEALVKDYQLGECPPIKLLYRIPESRMFILVQKNQMTVYNVDNLDLQFSLESAHRGEITNFFMNFGRIYSHSHEDGILCEWKLPGNKPMRVFRNDRIMCAIPSPNINVKICAVLLDHFRKYNSSETKEEGEDHILDMEFPLARYISGFQLNAVSDTYVVVYQDTWVMFNAFMGEIKRVKMNATILGARRVDNYSFACWTSSKVYVFDKQFSLSVVPIRGASITFVKSYQNDYLMVCNDMKVYYSKAVPFKRTIEQMLDEEKFEKKKVVVEKEEKVNMYEKKIKEFEMEQRKMDKKIDALRKSDVKYLRSDLRQKIEQVKSMKPKKEVDMSEEERKKRREERRKRRREMRMKKKKAEM